MEADTATVDSAKLYARSAPDSKGESSTNCMTSSVKRGATFNEDYDRRTVKNDGERIKRKRSSWPPRLQGRPVIGQELPFFSEPVIWLSRIVHLLLTVSTQCGRQGSMCLIAMFT